METPPLFIIGCPRSGVSLLEEILGAHPELAWVSQYQNKFPKVLGISTLNWAYGIPTIGKWLYLAAIGIKVFNKRILPYPTEPWDFLITHLPDFKKGVEFWKHRSWPKKNLDIGTLDQVHTIYAQLNLAQRKKQFFCSFADFPRMDYLSQFFPSARFIHLVRDGRAVCESLWRVNNIGHYNSWAEHKIWADFFPELWREQFLRRHYNLFALGIYRWMFYLDICWKESKRFSPERYMQISYEDILAKPHDTLRRIQTFAGLGISSNIDWYIQKSPPLQCNRKWRKALTKEQLDEFFDIVLEERFLELLREDM